MFPLQKMEAVHVYHLAVIQDLENSACHLQMKYRGSILYNCLYFVTVILLLANSPHSEHFDICQEGKIEGIGGRCSRRGTRG